ncbi:hypothetical protein FNJ88_06800 [Chryseobacterium sp. SNU WT5]|uniref:DUF6688 domain-containing protein n=1 Tax=Chryseobacterium sp. SNU WT5 TaxID=2594269 RepID=UPI001180EDC7|nr:DUF6688 family protein [Chryseobacterium sp. SNU WT5]QDP85287.1 hypothetical protein FNJ88_06800 [Chryseobacterium sp. SNU WT5]
MSLIGLLLVIFILLFLGVKILKNKKSTGEMLLLFFYLVAIFIFLFGFLLHDSNYQDAIDPIDRCYSPFGGKHTISLIVYGLFYHISAYFLWMKGRKLPPLFLVLCMAFIFIGLIINIIMLVQVSSHHTEDLDIYKGNDGSFYFIPALFISCLIGISLTRKIILEEKNKAEIRSFKNEFLNHCNHFLLQKYNAPIWAIIFLFPIFLIITIILILFGQDYNSMVKVFTDTATWTMSQKTHPPALNHRGHYLCTVSARGNPKLVKPLYLGTRHGQIIIVNRQLQIANAFEELITDLSPRLHKFIRYNYDKYGYNISLKINTEKASNRTYKIMKPIEYLFILVLYLCCEEPEKKIRRQYLS